MLPLEKSARNPNVPYEQRVERKVSSDAYRGFVMLDAGGSVAAWHSWFG